MIRRHEHHRTSTDLSRAATTTFFWIGEGEATGWTSGEQGVKRRRPSKEWRGAPTSGGMGLRPQSRFHARGLSFGWKGTRGSAAGLERTKTKAGVASRCAQLFEPLLLNDRRLREVVESATADARRANGKETKLTVSLGTSSSFCSSACFSSCSARRASGSSGANT
jgi:hypothetical protein